MFDVNDMGLGGETPLSNLSLGMTRAYSPIIFNKAVNLYNKDIRKKPKNNENLFNKYIDNYTGKNVVLNLKNYEDLVDKERKIYGAKDAPSFFSFFLPRNNEADVSAHPINRTVPYEQVVSAGKDRANALNKLVESDLSHATTNLGTNLGLAYSEEYAKNKVSEIGWNKLKKHLLPYIEDKFKDETGKIVSKGLSEGGDRILGTSVNKLGLLDLAKALNPLPLAFGAGAFKAGNAVIKQGLMGILGVQDAYHATTNESAKKILEHGLDPSRGGQRGGATRALVRESFERDNLYPTISANSLMSDPLQKIEVPTYDLLDEAFQRSFVGTGLVGKGSVGYYAAKTNPTGFIEKAKNVLNPINEAKKELKQTSIKNPIKKIKALGKLTKEVAATPLRVNDAYDFLYSKNPEDVKIVATAMPYHEFHERFEPDPQDVAYLRTGYRTKRQNEIAPLGEKSFTMSDEELDKHMLDALETASKEELKPITGFKPGELSYLDIIRARTPISQYGKYLKTPGAKKHLAKGVAYLGGGGFLTYQAANLATKPYRKLYKKTKGDLSRISNLISKPNTSSEILQKSKSIELIEDAVEENKTKLIDKIIAKKNPILGTLGAAAVASGIGLGINYYNKEEK